LLFTTIDTSGAEADLVVSAGAVDDEGSSEEDDDFIAKDEVEPDEEFDEVSFPLSFSETVHAITIRATHVTDRLTRCVRDVMYAGRR
jgi:hypothetical protein